MHHIRTYYQKRYSPRSISPFLFSSLVESLVQFKPELNTTSRTIKSRAVSNEKITDLHGPESWHVMNSHCVDEINYLHTELILETNNAKRCEMHIEFNYEHIFLSVSDVQTKWGKEIFEEAQHLLATIGIAPGDWIHSLTLSDDMLQMVQIAMLAFAGGVFFLWIKVPEPGYLIASASFFSSGVISAFRLRSRNCKSLKKLLNQSTSSARRFPWLEISAVLAFLCGLLCIVREVIYVLT